VAQIWDSIKSDPRHKGVELIVHHQQSRPLFSDWDMKFLRRSSASPAESEVTLPRALIQLVAELALRGDETAIAGGLQELMLMGQDFATLQAGLVEEAARLLGDWWLEDTIRASEITLALGYLQASLRRISTPDRRASAPQSADRQILMAPLPGEPHRLGVALVGDAFRRVGWIVTSEYPTSVKALTDYLQVRRYDALTLCLSDVLEGSDQIDPLIEAIKAARWACGNPALIILAGGRLFQRQPDLAKLVGADAVYLGAAEAQSRMADQMDHVADGEDETQPGPALH
jgi:methanogenic corrinoid protein MtbC1